MTDEPKEVRTFRAMMDWAVANGRLPRAGDGPGLGEAIRSRRLELGLRPAQAARKAFVPQGTWLNWEADQQIPTEEELGRVVTVLGEESAFGLWRRWRRAPRRALARALEAPPVSTGLRAARSAGVGPTGPRGLVLTVRNLDPVVRRGLAEWCAKQGREASEEDMATVLGEVRARPEAERERWIWQVAGIIGREDEP